MMIFDYAVLILVSILFRFDVGFRNFNKEVGLELSDTKAGTGYQNAITPPKLNWLSYAVYILFAIFLFNGFFDKNSGSMSLGFTVLGVIIGTAIISGVIMHPPNKPPLLKNFYLKTLYKSMTNRYADYKKNNDSVRADAMQMLIKKFEKKYLKELTL